jgi:hypothetical protein
MVTAFTDLQDGEAENLSYLVLSGLIARPSLPASLLNAQYFKSWKGPCIYELLPQYNQMISLIDHVISGAHPCSFMYPFMFKAGTFNDHIMPDCKLSQSFPILACHFV